MNLGQKTLLILLLTVLGLTAALYATTHFFLLRRFSALEQREMQNALERSKNAIGDDLAKLGATANDYGEWDRTYEFMERPSQQYIDQEFKNETLQGLGVNAVLILNIHQQVVFYKYYDPANQQGQASQSKTELAKNLWIDQARTSVTPASGLLLLASGPVLIAACPILTTERKGPPRGVLVMARALDSRYISLLNAKLRLSVAIQLMSSPLLPADFAERRSAFLSDPEVAVIAPWNKDVVAGYSLLSDVDGDPSLILRVDMPRDIFRQ